MINDDRIASPKQIHTGINFGWATYGDITPRGIDFRIVFIHLHNLLQSTGGVPLRGHCHSILNTKRPQVIFTYSQRGPESSGLLFDLSQSTRQTPSLPDKVPAP